MPFIKFIKDTELKKIGDIVKTSKKSAESAIKEGFAIYFDKIKKTEKKKTMKKKETKKQTNNIYDKWIGKITCAFKKNIFLDDNGVARVQAKRTKEREKYIFNWLKKDGSDNIVLIECPPDVIAIEFEEDCTKPNDERKSTIKERKEWVKKTYHNAKAQGIEGCIVDHRGTSPYYYAFNLKGLPEEKESEAKKEIAKIIVPKESLDFTDWTNLGKTLIPVIGRPHWKPKYNGAEHKIVFGTEPKDQKENDITKIINKVYEINAEEEIKRTPRERDPKIDEIKSKSDIKTLLNNYGYDTSKNPTMCKLGHGSKGKQCFGFTEDKGLWKCFHCGKGGDVFSLVMEHENLSFIESVKKVGEITGIQFETKNTETEEFSNYQLKKDDFGYLFKKSCTDKNGNPYTVEIADFDSIEKQKQISFDMIKLKHKSEKTKMFFMINSEGRTSSNKVELKNILSDAKRCRSQIYRQDEKAFSHFTEQFKEIETQKTNCYGYTMKGYFDYPKYKLYNTTYRQVDGSMIQIDNYISPSDSYKEFLNTTYEKKEIENIKQILNTKFARSAKERIYHKMICSWSISSALKMVLKKCGIKLHPLLIVLGEKRKGKSTAMVNFITSMWNNNLLQPDHFEGAKGTRLKQIDNNLFPVYCDELITLDRFSEILKGSTVYGYMKIPRGRKDGSIDENVKFFNLAVSSNKYRVNDPALKDRMIIFNYEEDNEPLLTETEVN